MIDHGSITDHLITYYETANEGFTDHGSITDDLVAYHDITYSFISLLLCGASFSRIFLCFFQSTETNMWTTFKMIINLVNVKVELLPSTSLHDSKTFIDPGIYSLAKIDFIKSKFVYEAFSDWSKTMDLVSQDVLLYDTRFEGTRLSYTIVHFEVSDSVIRVSRTNCNIRERIASTNCAVMT